VDQNSQPFFFLADTASRISHRLNRQEVDFYLTKRAQQGFTTILMAAVRAHPSEWSLPNQYGDRPFINDDITRPAITAGNNPNDPSEYDWWDHIDYIIDTAAEKGLTVALVPFAVSNAGSGFTYLNTSNAETYGYFIGKRYKDRSNIVWVLGWDNDPTTAEKEAVWNLMAKGITEGVAGVEDYSKTIMTFHPEKLSSTWFHNAPWLDINMIQPYLDPIHTLITNDYNLSPVKPTGIGEGFYELGSRSDGTTASALTIRKEAYWSFLAGGYYTYGNMSIWHFGDQPASIPHWTTAIDTASAQQMTIFKNFLTAREWWKYVPRQSVFASGMACDTTLNAAARSTDGRSILIYLSSPTTVSIRMNDIAQAPVRAEMMNPATGEQQFIGTFANSGTQQFTTPAGWEDAVLLLESNKK
jgi:hypothetical protein